MPCREKFSSTTNTRSIRCLRSKLRTVSWSTPGSTVTKLSLVVIMVSTRASTWFSKRISRLVTIPTNKPLSTTGKPEKPVLAAKLCRSPTVMSDEQVTGSLTTPLSCFLTRKTCSACSATVRFLWTIPMPPSWAMAIAKRASVTVSMAAEARGIFKGKSRAIWVCRWTSLGSTSE